MARKTRLARDLVQPKVVGADWEQRRQGDAGSAQRMAAGAGLEQLRLVDAYSARQTVVRPIHLVHWRRRDELHWEPWTADRAVIVRLKEQLLAQA